MIKIFKLIMPFAMALMSIAANCQPRHASGLSMFGVGTSLNSQEKGYFLSYQRYISDNLSYKSNLEYSQVTINVSDYKAYALNPEFYYTAFTNLKNLYINAKVGGFCGIQTINNEIFSKKNGIFYGESLGLTVEFFITHGFKAELGFEQRFLQKNFICKYSPKASISIYINL